MEIIKITYDHDKKVHIQSPFLAGVALCHKDAMSWRHSKRDVTCEKCLERQRERPFPTEEVAHSSTG